MPARFYFPNQTISSLRVAPTAGANAVLGYIAFHNFKAFPHPFNYPSTNPAVAGEGGCAHVTDVDTDTQEWRDLTGPTLPFGTSNETP